MFYQTMLHRLKTRFFKGDRQSDHFLPYQSTCARFTIKSVENSIGQSDISFPCQYLCIMSDLGNLICTEYYMLLLCLYLNPSGNIFYVFAQID